MHSDPFLPVDRVIPRPRRIIPALASSFMAGVLVSALHPVPLIPATLVCGACVLLCLVIRSSICSSVMLYLAMACAGIGWMGLADEARRPDYIGSTVRKERESACVSGRVGDMPSVVVSGGRTQWMMTVLVDGVFAGDRMLPASGRLRVVVQDVDLPNQPAYGEHWTWRGTFHRDDRSLLLTRGVAGTLYADVARSVRVSTNRGNAFTSWCYRMRDAARDRLGWGFDEQRESVALSRALLLGYRQEVSQSANDAFVRTGTLHVLALSGMHVGILVLLLVVVLKALGISRQYWVLFFGPFLITYTIATGAAASMVRATIMAIVYFSALLVRRRPDPINALFTAAMLIVLVDPLELFSLGFILSFMAVGGLVVIAPRIVACFESWWPAHDPATDSSQQRFFSAGRLAFTRAMAVSFSAWVVTLPLIVGISNLISPVSLFVNLLMGPLSFVMLLTGCLSLLSSIVSVHLAVTFNHANDIFADLLLWLVEGTSRWPAAYCYVPSWSWLALTCWYVLIGVAVLAAGWSRRMAMAALTLMVVVSLGIRSWSQAVEAVVIPCGDASVLLIDGPGNRARLFDAGSAYQNRNLVKELRKRGIHRLDQVWITRATTDAYGGIPGLLQTMQVEEVITPVPSEGPPGYEKAFAAWPFNYARVHFRTWREIPDSSMEHDITIRVMHPHQREPYVDARRTTMIVHVARGHEAVLFAGRMDHVVEEALCRKPVDWSAGSLVVGSCADPHAFGGGWLERVGPDRVIINLRPFERKLIGAGKVVTRLKESGVERLVLDANDIVAWSL